MLRRVIKRVSVACLSIPAAWPCDLPFGSAEDAPFTVSLYVLSVFYYLGSFKPLGGAARIRREFALNLPLYKAASAITYFG